jgi:hypothetical protein
LLNLQIDLADPPRHSITVHALHDPDALRRNAALLAKAQYVDHHRWRARDSGRGTARRRGVRARVVGPESAVGIGARQLGRPDNSLVAVAANVLGMEQTALVAELNIGKTIAMSPQRRAWRSTRA